MKFSIIIPCYNTGKYLEKCLKSILMQTYAEWEVIIVNDGSTDDSEEIIRRYEEQDTRVKSFYLENQGVSAARNRAIREVNGDYIMFCDSDDWYCDQTCFEQIAVASQEGTIDIVTFQYINFYEGKKVYGGKYLQYLNEGQIYTGVEYIQEVLNKKEGYDWYSCLYAFKKELFLKSKIEFDNTTYAYEDAEIIYLIIVKAKTISILQKPFYGYRRNREGHLTDTSQRLLISILKVSKNNIDKTNLLDINEKTKVLLNNNFAHFYYTVLILVFYLPKDEQKEIFRLLHSNRTIMNYTIDRRDSIVRKVTRILGLRVTARLLYIRSEWRIWSGRRL